MNSDEMAHSPRSQAAVVSFVLAVLCCWEALARMRLRNSDFLVAMEELVFWGERKTEIGFSIEIGGAGFGDGNDFITSAFFPETGREGGLAGRDGSVYSDKQDKFYVSFA